MGGLLEGENAGLFSRATRAAKVCRAYYREAQFNRLDRNKGTTEENNGNVQGPRGNRGKGIPMYVCECLYRFCPRVGGSWTRVSGK